LEAYPTDETMIWAEGTYNTAFQTSYTDIKPGYKVLSKPSIFGLTPGDIYVGPHAAFDSNKGDALWIAGAHVTAVDFGPLFASVAGGYARDRWNGPGAYGILETGFRF
jgi:hypothetical protein